MKSLFQPFLKVLFFFFLLASNKTVLAENKPFVKVVNQGDIGFSRNEKVELGIMLPLHIQEKVDNFVSAIGSPNEKINPYLEWELRVYAEFTRKDQTEKIIVDGFYYKEFESWNAEKLPRMSSYMYTGEDIKKLGGYKPKKTEFPFRIRFSSDEAGIYEAKVFLQIDGELFLSYDAVSFEVEDLQGTPFIGVHENKRFFSKGDEVYYPQGFNLSWPETDKGIDPELAKGMCGYSDYDKKIMCGNEGYMNVYVAPRTYQKYRELMGVLAENGSTMMRTIMYPTGSEIEWEELGNYTKRLHMAQELDSILETAEQQNLYLLWNLQIHYTFQKSERAYWRTWTWDQKMNGYDFCYKKLVKTDNPVDFFTNADAKRYYQQRLRYIIARWGYSPNIMGFELFSEISNVGAPKSDNSDFYAKDDNYKLFRDWQWEMASYIKSQHFGKKHLLTTSFAGQKKPEDDVFHSNNFDFMSSNIYDFHKPDFASYYNRWAGQMLDDRTGKDTSWMSYSFNNQHYGLQDHQIRKPLVFSEADANGVICDSTVIELRRAIWQSNFSGLAGSFGWDFRFRKDYYHIYAQMDAIMSKIDLAKNNWHPGVMKEVAENWEYNVRNDELMNPKVKQRGKKGKFQSPADVSFLRSGDKNYAFGVISNKTYNPKSTTNCVTDSWEGEYELLQTARNIDLKSEGPKVPGMNRGKYEIEYFYVSNPERCIGKSISSGPNLNFDFTIPANDLNYIVIFRAKKIGNSWKTVLKK